MTIVNYNLAAFNSFVRLQMDSLNARGETLSGVLINLFKGYLVAPNKVFNLYKKQKKTTMKRVKTSPRMISSQSQRINTSPWLEAANGMPHGTNENNCPNSQTGYAFQKEERR